MVLSRVVVVVGQAGGRSGDLERRCRCLENVILFRRGRSVPLFWGGFCFFELFCFELGSLRTIA